MYESKDEMVSHPQHYIRGGMETIDVITAFTEGLEGVEAYDTGAILKYICRWKQKGGAQDLEKAMWYTQHLIDHVNDDIKEDAEEGDEEGDDNGVTPLGKWLEDFAKRLSGNADESTAEPLHTVKVKTETAEEAEAGREYVDEVVRGMGIGTNICIVKGADGRWHTIEDAMGEDNETD